MQLYSGASQFVPKTTTKTLHSKAGRIHGIIVNGDGAGTVTFYDNTSAAGTILIVLDVINYYAQPLFLQFDRLAPLVFATGLTVVTAGSARCFVITEV
jgi:hypothetical protein